MQKPLVSMSILFLALQACSGKTGFQGRTIVAGSDATSDASGYHDHRDTAGGDASGIPGGYSSTTAYATGIADQTIDIQTSEMEAAGISAGADAVISVPSASAAGSSSGSSSAGPASGNSSSTPTTQAATLLITASSTQMRSGSAPMQMTAVLSGNASAADVTWTVGAPAGKAAGTISETGLYTPPSTGGGYDVVIMATLLDDLQLTASAPIKIVMPDQIFVGCSQGSQQFPITADVYQLSTNTTKLPDFSGLTKLTTVCMDQYNVSARDWSTGFPGVLGLNEWFALKTSTHLIVPSDGTYALRLTSDDGAKLYIDGGLIIDNDGQHAPTAKEASVYLTAGDHALTLDYYQGPRYQLALELFWKTPGSASYTYVPHAAFK